MDSPWTHPSDAFERLAVRASQPEPRRCGVSSSPPGLWVSVRYRHGLRGRGDSPDIRVRLPAIRVEEARSLILPRVRRWEVPVAAVSAALGLLLGQLLF